MDSKAPASRVGVSYNVKWITSVQLYCVNSAVQSMVAQKASM